MLTPAQPAPNLFLEDSDGGCSELADFRGRSPVFIYFMRTVTCPVCIHHVKKLAKLVKEFASAGVEILIAIPEGAAEAKAFKDAFRLPFPVVAGRGGTPHESLGLVTKVFGMLQQSGSVLVDRNGTIVRIHRATLPFEAWDAEGISQALSLSNQTCRNLTPPPEPSP